MDASRVYVGTVDRKVRILRVSDGVVVGELPVSGRLISKSRDGRKIALGEVTANGPVVRIWDTELNQFSGEWSAPPNPDGATFELSAAALNSNGSLLAVAGYDATPSRETRTVIVWDVAGQREWFRISASTAVRAFAF